MKAFAGASTVCCLKSFQLCYKYTSVNKKGGNNQARQQLLPSDEKMFDDLQPANVKTDVRFLCVP